MLTSRSGTATGHDILFATASELLSDLRPSIVQGESSTDKAIEPEIVVESAFQKVTGMTVPMGQGFEPQFMASYFPRIALWACNYSCGGADHPDVFKDVDTEPNSCGGWGSSPTEAAGQAGTGSTNVLPAGNDDFDHTAKRWLRTHGEAMLLLGPYAQILAT